VPRDINKKLSELSDAHLDALSARLVAVSTTVVGHPTDEANEGALH
jgi:hypothetical protein